MPFAYVGNEAISFAFSLLRLCFMANLITYLWIKLKSGKIPVIIIKYFFMNFDIVHLSCNW